MNRLRKFLECTTMMKNNTILLTKRTKIYCFKKNIRKKNLLKLLLILFSTKVDLIGISSFLCQRHYTYFLLLTKDSYL